MRCYDLFQILLLEIWKWNWQFFILVDYLNHQFRILDFFNLFFNKSIWFYFIFIRKILWYADILRLLVRFFIFGFRTFSRNWSLFFRERAILWLVETFIWLLCFPEVHMEGFFRIIWFKWWVILWWWIIMDNVQKLNANYLILNRIADMFEASFLNGI